MHYTRLVKLSGRVCRWSVVAALAVNAGACVQQQAVLGDPSGPVSAAPPAVAPRPESAASVPVSTTASVSRTPPDPHPLVVSLIQQVVAWAPDMDAQLAELELAGTGFASTQRTLTYLRYRLLREILLPAMAQSYDGTVRRYREALEQAALFDDTHPLADLAAGADQPAACARCEPTAAVCSPLCERERRRLRPATLAATELGAGLTFGGSPRDPAAQVTLGQFLDASVDTGLPRSRIEAALAAIVLDVVRRSRGLEGPPTPAEALGMAGHEALLNGYRRWEKTYASNREPRAMSSEPIVVDGPGQVEAWSQFEQAILRGAPGLARHALALRRYREGLVAAEREQERTATLDERPAIDCATLRAADVRRCTELTVGLHALELGVTEAVLAGDGLVAPALAVQVALALEHLSLAGLPPDRIDASFAQLLGDLGHRGVPRVEL